MNRNILLDVIKVIAAVLVIGLHCRFLYDHNKIVYQITSNGIFKIVIPLFFCINGFFLFDIFRKKNVNRWFIRVGILYLVWMLIYSPFWIDFKSVNLFKIIQSFLFGFNHLWYLTALLFGGFMLYKFKNLPSSSLLILSIILFITGVTIQYLGKFHVMSNIPLIDKILNFPPFHRSFLFYGFPFLSIGYIIRKQGYHTKFNKIQAIILLVFSYLFVVIDSLLNYYYLTSEIVLNMHFSFLLLAPILLIISFTFTMNSKINSNLLSSFSVGIYLIHPLVIFLIFSLYNLDSISLTVTTIILSFLLSYILIKINTKVKYLL
ncbi:acyltransferase family protein [Aquimarina litoralis]|uniref:acyltransferase family protein n=1 Tax=Aquimarina litoralis TaxID=584605 RepID=UPI0031D3FFA2